MKINSWHLLRIGLIVMLIYGVYITQRAKTENRSPMSLIIERVMKYIKIKDIRKKQNFEKALKESSVPYTITPKIRKKYRMHEYNNFTDTFIITPDNVVSKDIIFYLHGGAYWLPPLSFHLSLFKRISKKTGAQLIIPVYPKAPSYHATDVHKMILERYQYLLNEKHISAANIIIMGDSAGGGLALSFLQVLRDKGIPMPKQAILMSPWLDITNVNPRMRDIQPNDPILNIEILQYSGKIYAGSLDPHDPLVSPIYGDLENLPPVTLFSGTHDILHADNLKYSEIAKKRKLNLTLITYEKMNHCFIGFPIPESEDALKKIKIILEDVA